MSPSCSWLKHILILISFLVQIFDRLKKGVDPKLQEEKTKRANERELAQFEKAQRRLGELVYHCILPAQTYKSVWHIG